MLYQVQNALQTPLPYLSLIPSHDGSRLISAKVSSTG